MPRQKGSVMKKHLILFLVTAIVFSSGCAYTKIQLPLDQNFDNTELGTKEGRSSAKTVLFLISWGNAGTKAAAQNGNLKVIKHADREIFISIFGLYTRITTVVYGE
jgi:hypothetical protein